MKLILAALLLVTAVARAEDTANVDANAEIQSLAQDVATKFGLDIRKSTVDGNSMRSIEFSKTLPQPFYVTIGGNQEDIDVAWPIIIDHETSADTKVILEKILKLPQSAVAKMVKACIAEEKDLYDLRWNESITAHVPNTLPAEWRKSKKGELMWVTVPYITDPDVVNGEIWTSGGSSRQVGNIIVPTTNLALVVQYPGVPTYRKGDLKKTIIATEATRAALVQQIHKNIENFNADPTNKYGMRFQSGRTDNNDRYTVIDWATILKSYEK